MLVERDLTLMASLGMNFVCIAGGDPDCLPALQDFLYALSASDGVDMTRAADSHTDPARNGEPAGELGLVLPQDTAWSDQHGGPSDPQPGNSNGARDVLRSANFNNGTAQGFSPQIGTFSVANNAYQVAPSTAQGDAISLFNQADTVIPVYFEMQATINAVKPTAGNVANAYLIFDWQSNSNFKFAGINVSTNKIEMGHYTAANGWVVDAWTVSQLKAGTNYVVMLKANGSSATLTLGTTSVSFNYPLRVDSAGIAHGINDGMTGIGAKGGTKAQIDDVVVQAPPTMVTLDKTVDFSATSPASGLFNAATPASGTWVTTSDGRFVGTAVNAGTPAIDLIGYKVNPGAMVDINTTLRTAGQGGVVFDYQSPLYYKFVTLSADGQQIVMGHRDGNVTTIDKTYSVKLSATTDYALEVKVRAGLVNVSLNGGVVLSNLYNETATMGGYGLISMTGAKSAQTSFDIVRLRTDDAQYAAPKADMAAVAPAPADATVTLVPPTAAALDAIVSEAKLRWARSGLDAATVALMDTVSVRFDDLSGLMLADEQGGNIVLDINAAGWGWFIDGTPRDDREFVQSGSVLLARAGAAAGHMDLLTVVEHELGHAVGMEHSADGVMAETLSSGSRSTLGVTLDAEQTQLTAAWAATPGAAVAPTIDWSGAYAAPVLPASAAAKARAPSWQSDFVNHLARDQAQRNPNAGLRVQVGVSPKLSAGLGSLHSVL